MTNQLQTGYVLVHACMLNFMQTIGIGKVNGGDCNMVAAEQITK